MNRNKYKVLVLSNLQENAKDTIQYAIAASSAVNGALDLLCVKKPSEVITTENPLSAMRTVNKEFIKTEQKAKNIIEELTKDHFYAVKKTIEFGNVKNEIENYIEENNPDIIILGKKKKSIFKLNDDNITDFISKKYTNKVFIAGINNIADVYTTINLTNTEQTA